MGDLSEETPWPPAGCPALAWPALPDEAARHGWYRRVIEAYAALWADHASEPRFQPVGEAELAALEAGLGCALPAPLRAYHADLGALSLAEQLCSVAPGPTPIQPLMEAFPGLTDIVQSPATLALAEKLVVFGDYLGNGNMFCFHRSSGEVYYLDHDEGEVLTRFFPSTADYLDALMVVCLAEVHEDDEVGEALLVQRFGEALVRKWRY